MAQPHPPKASRSSLPTFLPLFCFVTAPKTNLQHQALTALRFEPSIVAKKTLALKVQYVRRWARFQSSEALTRYRDIEDPAQLEFLTGWIAPDTLYHQCVGLVNNIDGTNQLRIWDYGKWHLPTTDWASNKSIIAVRFSFDDETELDREVDWLGLKVPTGEWVTLMPNDVSAKFSAETTSPTVVPEIAALAATAAAVKNFEPLKHTVNDDQKRAILASVFRAHTLPSEEVALSGGPTTAPTMEVAGLTPTVYVGGNHMSPNPCPGVGVSRAIRLRFPGATTIAIDNAGDPLSGMTDTTFTKAIAVDLVMNLGNSMCDQAKSLHWKLITGLLLDNREALYMPNTDAEIDRIAESFQTSPPEEQAIMKVMKARLLSPTNEAAFQATEKPGIKGAKAMGCFQIPTFMTLDADKCSWTDVEEWCKVNGYPVVVKGPVQGAAICGNWAAVLPAIASWGAGGYVQKCATGFQMGLAYASYDGELTAALLMEKTGYGSGKAWSGSLRPVPPKMLEGLKAFCKEYNWTGGDELEYIEDFDGAWHAIDWNPRFPAWIFGGCYAGVNLPAALVQHALHKISGGVVPFPEDVLLASATATGGFTRTCIEIPQFHTHAIGVPGFPGFVESAGIGKAGSGAAPTSDKMNALPKGIKLGPQDPVSEGNDEESAKSKKKKESKKDKDKKKKTKKKKDKKKPQQQNGVGGDTENDEEDDASDNEDEAKPDMRARATVERELNALIPANTTGLSTPRFVLSRQTVREQLLGHKAAIANALAELTNPPAFKMCLSVKTQPHPVILAEAKQAGYLGEVITSAEMHACLDAGWAPNEIVMNGPGKWYGDMSGPRSTDVKPVSALRVLFADSLADLTTIIDRINDPEDWLDVEIVGVRFSPVAMIGSVAVWFELQGSKDLARSSGTFEHAP
jgi:hypothetical protein